MAQQNSNASYMINEEKKKLLIVAGASRTDGKRPTTAMMRVRTRVSNTRGRQCRKKI
jgi:hypothetical protein